MKKLLSIVLIAILIFSGYSASAFIESNKKFYQKPCMIDSYDLLIIVPEKFSNALQPLINHKNSVGIQTILETTENIYSSYNARDKPEEIKLRIKDAIEEWNITYVLLVGGRKGQSYKWYIPERKSNCYTFFGDHGYSTDLYYSDIYKEVDNQLVFDDWDSNGNGIFAEFPFPFSNDSDYDHIDYHPDVYLGRLPCRNINEVKIIVNKIIQYENNGCDPTWFKRFIGVGNDILVPNPHNDYSGIPEGDVMCDIAANYLEPLGFEFDKLFPSEGTMDNPTDFINAFNQGAGFIMITAHASPAFLTAHEINRTYGNEVFYSLEHMELISNEDKLPIIINCGCHCSQFNVTIFNFLFEMIRAGGYNNYIDSPEYLMHNWVPESVDWWWVRLENGGAIATIGNTHYGKMEHGETPYAFLDDLNPWIALRFFELYANQGIDILGEIHAKSISDYVDIVGNVNGGYRFPPLPRNQIEEWTLFGDPSLKIGGYS
jgi:hypothetical protein